MQKINRDWNNYIKSLVNRGSINFWLNEEALSKWVTNETGRGGRPFEFLNGYATFFCNSSLSGVCVLIQ